MIHDKTFQFDPDSGFVDQYATYINLANAHILRIPKGKVAKVMFATRPEILEYQEEPYVFSATNFSFDEKKDLVDKQDPYIHHRTIHIIRVPKGKLAKIWIGNVPKILPYQEEPYTFNDPLVKFDRDTGFVSEYEPYIKHGTIHIIRVPKDKFIKAWDGNTPLLLGYQKEPYHFDSPLFRVEPNNKVSYKKKEGKQNATDTYNETINTEDYFIDATKSLITHDSIKYVNPPTGKVAITYKDGELVIIGQKEKSKIIDDPNHLVNPDFLDVTVTNAVYPSEETRQTRENENKEATSGELSYEIFTTKDSLKVGVKIFVAYQVTDPYKAISKLGKDGIAKHIENITTVDMGKAIQQSTAQEFLNFYQTKPVKPDDKSISKDLPDLPVKHIQDEVKGNLAKDLEEYGITLIRLNIETPKVLNKQISDQMEQQSLLAAKTNAEMAVIDKQTELNQKKAKQDADTKRIAQQQQNEIELSKAETKLKASKLEAEATVTTQEAKSRAQLMQADTESKSIVLKAEAEKKAREMLGEQYQKFPELFNLEQSRIMTSSLQNANLIVTPEDMSKVLLSKTPLSFFNQSLALKTPQQRNGLGIQNDPVSIAQDPIVQQQSELTASKFRK